MSLPDLPPSDYFSWNNVAFVNASNVWQALQVFGNNISFGGAPLDVSSLAVGNILQYNGTAWVNVPASSVGPVSSVSNSDGTLTISPTTGSVVASLALGHANAWSATQTFENIAAGADNAYSIGTATNRFSTVTSNLFSVYHASGDANPTSQLGDGFLEFGPGGASARDIIMSRTGTNDLAIEGQSTVQGTDFGIYPPSGIGSVGNIAGFTIFAKSDGSTQYLTFVYQNISNMFLLQGATNNGTYIPIQFQNSGANAFQITTDPFLSIATVETFGTFGGSEPSGSTAWQFYDGTGMKFNVATNGYFGFQTNSTATPVYISANGLGISNDLPNTSINAVSQGTGTTTLYIGNAQIAVLSAAQTFTATQTFNGTQVLGTACLNFGPIVIGSNSVPTSPNNGLFVGSTNPNNAIWNASQGTGSTALYIGNSQIAVLSQAQTWTALQNFGANRFTSAGQTLNNTTGTPAATTVTIAAAAGEVVTITGLWKYSTNVSTGFLYVNATGQVNIFGFGVNEHGFASGTGTANNSTSSAILSNDQTATDQPFVMYINVISASTVTLYTGGTTGTTTTVEAGTTIEVF
jgi:hypothetical protein